MKYSYESCFKRSSCTIGNDQPSLESKESKGSAIRMCIHSYVMNIHRLIKRFFVYGIKGYKYLISPLFPPSCRFTPTCSEYALQAIEHHGVFRGLLYALWRILRCHPFSKGGHDPVCCRHDV